MTLSFASIDGIQQRVAILYVRAFHQTPFIRGHSDALHNLFDSLEFDGASPRDNFRRWIVVYEINLARG